MAKFRDQTVVNLNEVVFKSFIPKLTTSVLFPPFIHKTGEGHLFWRSGYCTLPQLKEMYAYGWDMANHTMNHATLKDLKDTAAIEKEIGDAEDWLNANGFTKASNILAYPYGAYDARVLQVMQSRRAGRTVQDDTATTPPPDKRTIKIRNVDHTITPTTLKEHIDAAVNVGAFACSCSISWSVVRRPPASSTT